jgi:hypothetical protein
MPSNYGDVGFWMAAGVLMPLVMIIAACLIACTSSIMYVLNALCIRKILKKCRYRYPDRAWIPFVSTYALFEATEDDEFFAVTNNNPLIAAIIDASSCLLILLGFSHNFFFYTLVAVNCGLRFVTFARICHKFGRPFWMLVLLILSSLIPLLNWVLPNSILAFT